MNTTAGPSGALARLRAALPTLSSHESKVARWILGDPAGVGQRSMLDVAHECGVSDTTVLRMCRASGFAGFTDLKFGLTQDLATEVEFIHEDVTPDDDPGLVAQKVFAVAMQSLRDTLEILNPVELAKAVDLLDSARHVLVGGVGTSGVVAQSFYQRCHRIGVRCDAPTDAHLQILHASLLGPGDLAIGVSHSGATKEVVTFLSQAREVGAATLAVTGNKTSPLAQVSDVVLVSVSGETRSEPLAARASEIAILDAVCVAYSLRHLDEVVEAERRLNQAIAPRAF